MSLPREEVLAGLAALFLLGIAATAERILRARRHGFSVRLQVFVPLAATTLSLAAVFAAIIIDRVQARAEVFAQRAADDEARVLAVLLSAGVTAQAGSLEVASRALAKGEVLQAFSRGPSETEVSVVGPRGELLLMAGSVPRDVLRTGIAEASASIRAGDREVGLVKVRRGTVGMAQLLSDVAPRVTLLALILSVASALVAILIGRAVAGPIERLTRAAERVAAGERQASLPEPRGLEVRMLTRALESMRRELEERHALETFVADLSHELKNPIASIRASAEVLEEAADEPVAARRFARRILESADKLMALTADLLSLARLEARGIAQSRRPIDLCAVVREAADAQSPLAAARGVRVELLLPSEARLHGDPVWLRRAIENLIGNALQHSPPAGKVGLSVREGERSWSVDVSDAGPGVDPDMRERLFRRFATTRHGDGGTGLGLAIVRTVAELHGGTARLAETGPRGATFTVELPR